MKKIIMAVSALFCLMGGTVHAGSVVYNQNLVNETALAVDQNYTLDLGNSNLRNSNIGSLSAQAVYAQAAPSAATFTDGVASTATITVSSMTALRGLQASDKLTIVSNSLSGTAASVTVNVASNTFLASNVVSLYFGGVAVTSVVNYDVASSSIGTAVNLAAAIDRITGFDATSTGSTVTITCSVKGTANNGKGIVSSAPTRLVLSAATFTGGVNNAFFTLNGSTFTQGIDWTVGASSATSATAMAAAINAYPPTSRLFTADANTLGVVNIVVNSSGTAGNAYRLTTSNAALISTQTLTFAGGVNNAILAFNINGTPSVILVEGTDFNAITSSIATATSIKAAIDANSTLSALVSVSTAVGGIANLTSKGVGLATNFGIMTSSPAALSITNKRMFGGTATALDTATNSIGITAHGYTTGLPLLYAKTAGTSPGLLVTGTTYYAIRSNANSFKLAASTTAAVAGTAVSIATQTATGGGSFTLTPLAYSGKANTGFKWQASNDNSNWNDLSVSSVTYSSPSTTTSSTFWDFGAVNYRYLRLVVISPTRGGLYLVVPVIGNTNN